MLVLALWYRAYKNEDFSADDHAEIKNEIALLKKNGINYSGLYKIISLLDKNNSLLQSGVSITKVIEESQLSSDAKSYFKKLFQICEERTFGIKKESQNMNFEMKYFREIFKLI